MASENPEESFVPRRRVPTQERSRRRVADLLDGAAELVEEKGVEALSTRAIAERAGVPVASLYQYFADKEDVLLALLDRAMVETSERVEAAVAALPRHGIADMVAATTRAYAEVFRERRALVQIWLRGRTNPAVSEYGRAHNQRIAQQVVDAAVTLGMAPDSLSPKVLLLAVELGDRALQLAFADSDEGDQELIDESIVLITAYLEKRAPAVPGA